MVEITEMVQLEKERYVKEICLLPQKDLIYSNIFTYLM
jgi:hypothetical protein